MKSCWIAFLAVFASFCLGYIHCARADAEDRPNIVLMLSDDQGWSGLSVPMDPEIPESQSRVIDTPHLESFAAQGMRFTQGYAPASVCSPTRISLQTGKSPARMHWTKAAPPESGRPLIEPALIKRIDQREITLGEMLREAGYATAHYGKWHLGGGGPGSHGYDEHDGDTGNEQAFKFQDPNPVDIFGMAERAAAFMKNNRDSGKPFFIQLSWNALHASENASKAALAKYEAKMGDANRKAVTTAAISEDLDRGVGKVLEAIEALGLTDTTYVLYMSDNGSGGGGKALRGGKGGMWEGGIRVPMILRGPGIEAGSICPTPVVGYDWFPTFCHWAGIPADRLPNHLDGGSLIPLLQDPKHGKVIRPREELIFHFPHYQGDTPHTAIRLGNLKLLHFYEDGSDLLFDLSEDPRESRDLAPQRTDDVQLLKARMEAYLKEVEAGLPKTNPDYQEGANAAPAGRKQRSGRGNGQRNGKP
jgi:arylsulfatase A-like enzyme